MRSSIVIPRQHVARLIGHWNFAEMAPMSWGKERKRQRERGHEGMMRLTFEEGGRDRERERGMATEMFSGWTQ